MLTRNRENMDVIYGVREPSYLDVVGDLLIYSEGHNGASVRRLCWSEEEGYTAVVLKCIFLLSFMFEIISSFFNTYSYSMWISSSFIFIW